MGKIDIVGFIMPFGLSNVCIADMKNFRLLTILLLLSVGACADRRINMIDADAIVNEGVVKTTGIVRKDNRIFIE